MVDFRLLGFGFLLFFGSSVGQTFFIGFFGDDIRESVGLSNEHYGYLYSGATVASALLLPFVGRLLDRWDLRVFASAVCLGLALSAWGMSQVQSVALLGLVLFGLRFFGQGLLSHTSSTSAARYFDSRRGLALSIVALGYSVEEAWLPGQIKELQEIFE